jgi:putative inorganic carbon (HCO3(-)) transporter
MYQLANSVSFRGSAKLVRLLTSAGRHSLIGRALSAMTRAFGKALASSVIFGTERLSSVPLSDDGLSLGVRTISRPYLWLRSRLAEGPVGQQGHRLASWAEASAFAAGEWVRLVGAVLLGTGSGRVLLASLGRLTKAGESAFGGTGILWNALCPVVAALVGLLAVIWGPRLVPALRERAVFRRSMAPTQPSRSGTEPTTPTHQTPWVVGVGTAVCVACGLVAGLAGSTGPAWLASLLVAIGGAVLLLCRPEAVLLMAAAFPWLDWLARTRLGVMGAAWDEGLLLLSLGLVLWGGVVSGRLRLRTVHITLPVMLAFVAGVGSVVVNRVPQEVGLFALRVVFEPVLFFFVGFLLFTTMRWVRRVVAVFQVSTVALAIHGLYQYIAHVPTPTQWLDSSETDVITTRAFSIIGNPNGLGSLLAIGCLVALGLLLSPALGRVWRSALALALAIQLGGLAVTFSRGAWMGLACGVVAMLVLAYRRYLVPAVLAASVAVLAAPGVFVNRFLLAFSSTYLGKAAIDGRTYRWAVALEQIAAHPWFGLGLGTWGGSSAERFQYWSFWIDNYYLQMGPEGGLLLLAFFLWLLLRVGKGLVKGFRLATDAFARALAAGVFGAFVAAVVANVFVSVWETLSVGAAFWLLSGLATSAALSSAGEPRRVDGVTVRSR